jgi:hypothetical protein
MSRSVDSRDLIADLMRFLSYLPVALYAESLQVGSALVLLRYLTAEVDCECNLLAKADCPESSRIKISTNSNTSSVLATMAGH